MRRDIQFLRGLAVLAVLLYHANFLFLPNGYLGVDVFFVISGFLITSIILTGLAENEFSFAHFYLKRARRLLPALYSTLGVVTLISYAVLTDRQWDDFRSQLYGALTFTSNMVLPFQVGYFEDAADTKPLLHMWSLSIEEQYYLILPLILWLTGPKYRGLMLLGLASVSLFLCQLLLSLGFEARWLGDNNSSVWAFYLLPTRAWQLLVGSLVAWQMFKYPDTDLPKSLKAVALLALFGLFCFSIDNVAVRGNAVSASVLTAILLMGKDNWLPDITPIRIIERAGDWSYSLYLVHWPLLAFTQIAFLGQPPVAATVLVCLASLLLAFLQYTYVEQRFRYTRTANSGSIVAPLSAFTVLIVAISLPSFVNARGGSFGMSSDNDSFREINFGFGWQCSRGENYINGDACRNSNSPRVAVWGDSFAMHLIPGLLKNAWVKDSLVQITRSNCNPILGLTEASVGFTSAQACIEFNADAINYIASSSSVETVIIGSPFGYFYGGSNAYYVGDEIRDRDTRIALIALEETIELLQGLGKKVFIFSPPPSADFDVGECLERKYSGALTLGRKGCEISFELSQSRMSSIISALKTIEQKTGAKVIWLSDELCDGPTCRSEIDSIPVYRDRLHLSVQGSEVLIGPIPLE